MTLCGIHEAIAYSLKYPGRSRYELACQGSELMIGLGKLFCAQQGTGKWNMPQKLSEYYDLIGIVKVKNNQIDVSKIITKMQHKKLLIFNKNKCIRIESSIEKDSPFVFQYMVKLLNNWEVGTPMPQLLRQIMECITLSPNAWKIEKIIKICATNCQNVSANNIQIGSNEYNAMVAKIQEIHEDYVKNPNVKNSMKLAQTVLQNAL